MCAADYRCKNTYFLEKTEQGPAKMCYNIKNVTKKEAG